MHGALPPLRLTGAVSLRDGRLRRRSVALKGGRFTTGPLPAVDMTGFYLLPGIVDLAAAPTGDTSAAPDVPGLDRAAARAGVTTRCVTLAWGWDDRDTPARAATAARAIAAPGAAATDLRVHLVADRLLVEDRAALLALADTAPAALVTFAAGAEAAADLRATDAEAFARLAWTRGVAPDILGRALDAALARRREVPRHLCALAEAFDRIGVLYGSTGDASAEVREHYSMIGARLCHAPGTAQVAAAAHAVGDPVILAAPDTLGPARPAARNAALIRAGLCDALVSGAASDAQAAAAFRLAEKGVLPLAAAWRLISSGPAEILRLPDRGVIAPGKRADLAIVNAATRRVEATICAGRLTFATGTAAARLAAFTGTRRHAAE